MNERPHATLPIYGSPALLFFFLLDLRQVLFNSDLTTVTFATSVSSTITVFVTAVVLNDDGSFFVAGSFTGTSLTIGATVVLEPEVSGGSNDYNNFLAKFDSAGNVAYVKVRVIHARF